MRQVQTARWDITSPAETRTRLSWPAQGDDTPKRFVGGSLPGPLRGTQSGEDLAPSRWSVSMQQPSPTASSYSLIFHRPETLMDRCLDIHGVLRCIAWRASVGWKQARSPI